MLSVFVEAGPGSRADRADVVANTMYRRELRTTCFDGDALFTISSTSQGTCLTLQIATRRGVVDTFCRWDHCSATDLRAVTTVNDPPWMLVTRQWLL